MDSEVSLEKFLSRVSPTTTETVIWGSGMRFAVSAYLTDETPPFTLITSVSAVVSRENLILVQEDQSGRHVMPGGRREEGETLEATFLREVGEETGWLLSQSARLGFLHFRHLDPKPPCYAYPYPDFFRVMFAAKAESFLPEIKLDDGFEVGTEFCPTEVAQGLPLSEGERAFLNAALEVFALWRHEDGLRRS